MDTRTGSVVRACCVAGAVVLLRAAAPGPAATTWTLTKTQVPQVHNGSLAAESCPSAAACIAVGFADGPAGPARTLAEAWNRTTWRILPTPNPRGSRGSNLNAVSCRTATACTAIGTYVDSSGTQRPLAEAWNGNTWTIRATPDQPGSHGTVLDGVSCTAASACTAVGLQALSASADLAEAWNGATWTTQPTPAPAGASSSSLTGVSCAATGGCGAVGYSFGPSGIRHALAGGRSGTTWTLQAAADPRGARDSSLDKVSCASASSCVAVGPSTAQGWNGTRWRDLSAIQPPGAASIDLTDVSCATATACLAVGFYTNGAGGGLLAESWNGTVWTLRPPASPSGATGSSLNGVSCATATACIAVGSYINGSGARRSLAESWNGSAWNIRPTAEPANSRASELNGVSCTSARSCTAVGDYDRTPRVARLELAEAWNGTAWHLQHAASPSDTEIVGLDGVSCMATGGCTAVGGYGPSQPSFGVFVPFAEQRH